MNGALDGIKVLDLSRVVSGPYASMILGDHGAEVCKVEEPSQGDDSRSYPPHIQGESTYFMSINRNKKSVALNIKDAQDKETLFALVRSADVFLHNFRPDSAARLGIDYPSLREINRQLIYCSVSAYGPTGPYADWPGYDLFVAGIGGLMSLTGEANSPPQRAGINVVDYMAGMNAALGILLALQARNVSGEGQEVKVSLLDGLLAISGHVVAGYAATGVLPTRSELNQHRQIVPYGTFRASDGYINVGVVHQKFWSPFCQVLELPEVRDDQRFASAEARVENRQALLKLIRPVLSQKTSDVWLSAFEAAGVPCGPIHTFDDVVKDPQVQQNEIIQTMTHPACGEITMAGVPIKLSHTPGSLRLPPPRLGEHKALWSQQEGTST